MKRYPFARVQEYVESQLEKKILPTQKITFKGGRTQFPRGQQYCVKASAAFKKQNKLSNAYNWFKYCLFSNEMFSSEMDLMNPRVTDRGTQLNAAHAQLLEKLRPITFAETCRFLTFQSLEFQENSLETT